MNHYDFEKFHDLNQLEEYYYDGLPETERLSFLMQFLDSPLHSKEDLVEMFLDCNEAASGNYEAIVAFSTKYNRNYPEEYASDYAYIEAELLPTAFFLGDKEQIARSLSVMKQNPLPGLQIVIRETLFHLLYYGYYNEALDLAKCVAALDRSANDISDFDLHPFITILYLQKLEEQYERWRSGGDSNLAETIQEIAELGFDSKDGRLDMVFDVLRQIAAGNSKGPLPVHFDGRLLTANIHFLVHMKTMHNIPFMLSDFWFNPLYKEGLFRKQSVAGAEYYISAEKLIEYYEDCLELDIQDTRLEFSGKFWGLQYVYGFLFRNQWIAEEWFLKMNKNLNKTMEAMAAALDNKLWLLNYLVSWPEPPNPVQGAYQDGGIYRKFFDTSQALKQARIDFARHRQELRKFPPFPGRIEDDTEAEPDDQTPFPIRNDPTTPFRKDQKEPGRNEPCPCGSGRKYKKCCMK